MSSRFCEQCGSVITAEDRFCGSCGNPVDRDGEGVTQLDSFPAFLSSSPQDAGVSVPEPAQALHQSAQIPSPAFQPSPQQPSNSQPAGNAGGPSLGVLLGGMVVVLIVLGGAAWYGWDLYTKSLGKPPVTSAKGDQTGSSGQKVQPPSGIAPPAAQDGDRFLGLWAPEKQDDPTENQEIKIVRKGTLLVCTSQMDRTGHIELNVGPGDKLEGVYKESGSADVPVTAELLNDGKRLILTLAPPQSEFETVVLLRVNEAEKAAAVESQNSGADEVPGIVPISGVDEAYAQKVVSQQKEVKEFINLLAQKGKTPIFEIEPEDSSTWMVRVYEVVEDGDGMSHTATFGWYKVDRTTGAVSPGM